MANVNTPDVTTPVPLANRSRFMGVTGNMDNGTAKGGTDPNGLVNNVVIGGNANNNIGGVIYRAAGQSANQFPVSAADVESTGNGGSAPAITNSSNNPLTVQAQTLSRVNTETVAETTPALVSKSSAGNFLTFPSSTEEIALGTGSVNSTSSNLTISREQPANAYVGITDTLTFGNTNDLDVLAEERRVVVGTNAETDGRVDGKAQGANSEDKFQSVNGANLMTPSITKLPGGVAISPEIGESNVSGLGL